MCKVVIYTLTDEGLVMPISNDTLLNQQPTNPLSVILSSTPATSGRYGHEQAEAMLVPESLGDSSPPAEKKKNPVGRKRKRNNNMHREKPSDVVHVRARRGQATDSHSLAERGRREKINEKLRFLQDMVPGCYKAMGMAVMLDVIINYVQSLQQQIEFLSMKLSAAGVYFDCNTSEMDAAETMQKSGSTNEIQVTERIAAGEGYGGICYFNPTWPLY